MNIINILRNILDGPIDADAHAFLFNIPEEYRALLNDLKNTEAKPSDTRFNLVSLDRLLTRYFESRLTKSETSELKYALLNDEHTASLFINRMSDHHRMLHYTESPRSTKKRKTLIYSLAAAIAALFFVLMIQPENSIYRTLDYTENPPLNMDFHTLRGESSRNNNVEKVFVDGIKYYLACEYDSALTRWSSLNMMNAGHLNIWLYTALSHIALAADESLDEKLRHHHAQTALNIFRKYSKLRDEKEIYFYIVALLLDENRQEARRYAPRIQSPALRKQLECLSPFME